MSDFGRQKIPNISDEEAQNETRTTKSNRDPVRPPVRQSESFLGSSQDDGEGIPLQNLWARSENLFDFFEPCVAHEFGNMSDNSESFG